jgi:hypothetical protein
MRAVNAAMLLMMKVGCEVQELVAGDTHTLTVTLPVESVDPHGDNYLNLLHAQTT